MLAIILNCLPALSLQASPLLYNQEADFHERYVLLKEIGHGTFSTVFLSQDNRGELVAIKKYAITDKKTLDIFKKNRSSVGTFIEQLAVKEWHIGQLTDHPNIVKIREISFDQSTAYIVMDYVEGRTLNYFEKYNSETRIAFMQQFLSAVEHLLLRNILIDDLWSENILISPDGSRLTLVDLGGNEIINHDADMSLGHYLEMIENMLENLGGESAKVLDHCKHCLPTTLREEIISSAHVKVLISWIEALQKELATPLDLKNTFCEASTNGILAAHAELQSQHPDDISFNTAQHSNFLPYSIIAAHVLKKFSPGKYQDSYLQNTHILRYPRDHQLKSLQELFQLLPMRDDYDTASGLVGDALISVSPSLKEKESQESAWAIFENNERKVNVGDYICDFFESEKVSPVHFRSRIKAVVKEAPKSKQGLIYNFFIPKNAPLYKAIFLSEPYGIPVGDPHSENNLLNFYEQYEQGLVKEENPQLRFLPSALTPENHFDLTKIKSYRFTTIPREELTAYIKKVENVVNEIYKDHLEEMLQLAALASEMETQSDQVVRQNGYQELCYKHLCRRDLQLALFYWRRIEGQSSNKYSLLSGIIACLLSKNQLHRAENYFQLYETELVHKEQIIARFALIYIEQDNQPMLDSMLNKLSDSDIKKFILFMASARYPEYAQENSIEDFEGLISDDEILGG